MVVSCALGLGSGKGIGVGETVDRLGAAACGSETAGVAVSRPGEPTRVGDSTGGALFNAPGSEVIDDQGVAVDTGTAVGDELGAEAVPHPSSPRMTTNVSARVLKGHTMSRFYQTGGVSDDQSPPA